jgi:hypothetical protein
MVDVSGKVGIGTNSPASLLHLKASSPVRINLQTTNDATNYLGALRYQYNYNEALQLVTGPSDIPVFNAGQDAFSTYIAAQSSAALSQIFLQGDGVSDGHIKFLTANAERMRIDRAGNLGIGTAAPQKALTLGPSKIEAFEIATPGAPGLVASGSGGSLASNTYYYKITVLDSSGGETSGGTEASVAVTGPTGKVTLTWTGVAGASTYRIYRGTSAGNENTYYSTPAVASPSYVDTGATGTSGSPPSVTTAYLSKCGNATVSSAAGTGTIRLVQQLLPGHPVSGDSYSTGIYVKTDLQSQQKQTFGLFGEILNQPDGYGGFCRVNHSGLGDAFYVQLNGTGSGSGGNVAFEAATYVDNTADFGSKGIISTNQASSPNPANVLFTALWDNATVPRYSTRKNRGATHCSLRNAAAELPMGSSKSALPSRALGASDSKYTTMERCACHALRRRARRRIRRYCACGEPMPARIAKSNCKTSWRVQISTDCRCKMEAAMSAW